MPGRFAQTRRSRLSALALSGTNQGYFRIRNAQGNPRDFRRWARLI